MRARVARSRAIVALIVALGSLSSFDAASASIAAFACRAERIGPIVRLERLSWLPEAGVDFDIGSWPEMHMDESSEAQVLVFPFVVNGRGDGCGERSDAYLRRVEARGETLLVEPRDAGIGLRLRRDERVMIAYDATTLKRELERLGHDRRWRDSLAAVETLRAELGTLPEGLSVLERRARGMAAYGEQDYPTAVGALAEVARRDPDDDVVGLALAVAHYRQKDYRQAAKILSDLYRRFPDNGEVPYRLGVVEVEQDRHQLAIRYFEDALDKGFDEIELHLYLGFALFEEGRFEAAERHLERCVYPGAPSVLATRASSLLLKIEQHARFAGRSGVGAGGSATPPTVAVEPRPAGVVESQPVVVPAPEDEPTADDESPPPDAYAIRLARAREHYRRGEYESARRLSARLIEEQPDDADALYLAGLIELSAGESGAAIDPLEEAGSLGRDEAFFYLGFAFFEVGDPVAARRSLEHYLSLDQDGELADKARRLLDEIRKREEGS